jgi:ADP-heptose:LPS heptosyltransferase
MRLKRLELWWRRVWIWILVRLMRQPAGSGPPDWAAGPRRILFLRHDRAGDMILSTGVMRAIARSQPGIIMDVLASPANAAVIESASYVGDVVVFDKKKLGGYLSTVRRLRRARYDAVIDCMVTAPSVTTLLLILSSGARYRIGIAGRGNDSAFNVTVPPDSRPRAHMVDLLAALAPAFGLGALVERGPTLELRPDERARAEAVWGSDDGLRILINVSAGTSERNWPDANFAALVRRARERESGAVVLVIGAPAEVDRAQRVAADGGGTYAQTPSIRDAFALVASADLLVTPDTSITHAASAFKVPSVVLFVRGKSERWGLYDTPGANVEHEAESLSSLPLPRVLHAFDDLLDDAIERRGVRNASLGKTR